METVENILLGMKIPNTKSYYDLAQLTSMIITLN